MSAVYLIGPMTGRPAYNFDAFQYARGVWERGGWAVKTPFDADSIVWQRHFGRDFDPFADRCDYGDPLLAEMVVEGMAMMCAVRNVALMPGWEKSRGTLPELLVAQNLRFAIYDAESMFGICPRLKLLAA